MKIILFFSLTLISSHSFAGPKMKGWCHGYVDVFNGTKTCQEYRCPKEGENGKCPKNNSSVRIISKENPRDFDH